MHHRVRGAILGTIAALLLPRASYAQGPDEAASEEQTSPTADAKPAEPAPAQPVAAPAPAPVLREKPKWEPYGYLRMQYRVVQNDPNVQFVGRDDGFELQNARLGARGKLGDKASFVVSIDGAVDERAQINSPDGKLKVGLRDAFADVVIGAGGA